MASVQLRQYTEADLQLTLELESDPVTMRELGGPRPEAAIRDVHLRRLGEPWWLVIAGADGTGIGAIGVWETEHDGETVHETGWMVLPTVAGRGVGSQALGILLDRIRADGGFGAIHAFPGASNVPSNRLCEKFGFRQIGVEDVTFSGRRLRCNHWRLDLPA